jgi:hypothetical protein
VIELCLEHLTTLPLEPPYVIALVNILKYYTWFYRVEVVDRIIKDTVSHFAIFRSYHLDILYYVNIVCF